MVTPRLEIKSCKVRELVDDYRAGKMVIPEFQREYVWKPSRAPKLIDSLYNGYPVSMLLVWVSDEVVRVRRVEPRPNRSLPPAWLIDGQQRVITLSRVLNGDEGIDVVFRPETEEFRLANATTHRDRNWVRVSDILDDDLYRSIRRTLPDGRQGEVLEIKYEKLRGILDYEVPVVQMKNFDFEQVVDAFTRINTLGVKLKTEDIHSAKVAAKHSGFIADEVSPFLAKLRKDGFNRLNIMHLFRACAFVAIPDGRSRTPLHELDLATVTKAWSRTKKATEEAISLVRNHFGLINMDILWSGALLVPVIAICSSGVRDRDAKGVAAWLALAALRHRYSGASETALDQDLKACRSDEPIKGLVRNISRYAGLATAVPDDFKGGLNDKGAMFAAYVACYHRGLKDLFTGSRINLQYNVDRHHLLPRAQFSEKIRASADTIANIAFINSQTNRAIGAEFPDVYLSRLSGDILTSQCIPSEKNLWNIDSSERFFNARRQILADAFNDFLLENLTI